MEANCPGKMFSLISPDSWAQNLTLVVSALMSDI
jgi:hypothetical protein